MELKNRKMSPEIIELITRNRERKLSDYKEKFGIHYDSISVPTAKKILSWFNIESGQHVRAVEPEADLNILQTVFFELSLESAISGNFETNIAEPYFNNSFDEVLQENNIDVNMMYAVSFGKKYPLDKDAVKLIPFGKPKPYTHIMMELNDEKLKNGVLAHCIDEMDEKTELIAIMTLENFAAVRELLIQQTHIERLHVFTDEAYEYDPFENLKDKLAVKLTKHDFDQPAKYSKSKSVEMNEAEVREVSKEELRERLIK